MFKFVKELNDNDYIYIDHIYYLFFINVMFKFVKNKIEC